MKRRIAIPILCLLSIGLTTCGAGGIFDGAPGVGTITNWVMATAPHTTPVAATGTGMNGAEQALALAAAQWINGHRLANGLGALTWANNVAAVADGHAVTMATLGLMDHQAGGTTLGQRLAAGAVGYSAAAENIAWNYPTGQAVSEGWMNSNTGHREAILGNYTHFGLAVRDMGGGPYWCCVFIRP